MALETQKRVPELAVAEQEVRLIFRKQQLASPENQKAINCQEYNTHFYGNSLLNAVVD